MELLNRRLRNPALKPETLTFGTIGIIRRQSTRKLRRSNSAVSEALEYIRREACNKLNVNDVVATMKCSRRLAELRFREILGHSILDEIHEVRFMCACELLANSSLKIKAITDRCGYDSEAFLRKMFKKKTGLTMTQWRKCKNE